MRALPRPWSRRIDSALTLLPLPDSPTMPRHSRGCTAKLTSSTTVSQPASPRNWTVRLSTASSGPGAISGLDLEARIEHVAQPVAEQVHAERRQAYRGPGEQHDPPGLDR